MEEIKTVNKKNRIFVLIGLVVFVIAFILVFKMFKNESEKRSVYLEDEQADTANYINITASIVTIDPNKGDMSVRLDFFPKGTLADDKEFLNEEIDLFVNSATGKQEYSFAKGRVMSPIDVTLNLYDGLITDYPLDKHKAELILITSKKVKSDKSPADSKDNSTESVDVDNGISFSGSVTGYKIKAELDPESGGPTTDLNIEIERAGSVMFFSFFVMGVMWMLIIMLCFMLYGILVNGRKVEIAMFAFAAALLFAFPAFRNMMPLAPPIGAFPDFVAFFWAEAFAAGTLIILIGTFLFRKQ